MGRLAFEVEYGPKYLAVSSGVGLYGNHNTHSVDWAVSKTGQV
jgi:hypothetical protein